MPSTQKGFLRQLWRIFKGASVVDGHLSTANHAHIHRHLGELWFVSESNDINQDSSLDLVIENPADSGNVVEIIAWSSTLNDEGNVTAWRGSEFSDTATSVEISNYDEDITGTPDANAQTGVDIVDIGSNGDTRLPGAAYTSGRTGNTVRGTIASIVGLDVKIAEGSTFALHTEAGSNNVTPLTGVTFAEYPVGRDIVTVEEGP